MKFHNSLDLLQNLLDDAFQNSLEIMKYNNEYFLAEGIRTYYASAVSRNH